MLLLRAVLNIIVRNMRPRGPMCFRRLMFNLSGPCYFDLLALGVVVSVCYILVFYMLLCWCICLPCVLRVCQYLLKQFAICIGVVYILLLNVMVVFSVGGGALLDSTCMVFQRMCVLCL